MKRSLILLALAGMTSVALAQTPTPQLARGWPQHAMAARMHRMEQWRLHQLTVLLGLTSAQRQQVQAILAEQHAAMRTSMQKMMRAMRAMREAHVAAKRQMMAKMAHVLTAEQMAKFKVLVPPHPWAGMHGPMGPGAMGMRMRMHMAAPQPPAPPAAPQS
jgi:Spy/CpxP family protein refolding chaperone